MSNVKIEDGGMDTMDHLNGPGNSLSDLESSYGNGNDNGKGNAKNNGNGNGNGNFHVSDREGSYNGNAMGSNGFRNGSSGNSSIVSDYENGVSGNGLSITGRGEVSGSMYSDGSSRVSGSSSVSGVSGDGSPNGNHSKSVSSDYKGDKLNRLLGELGIDPDEFAAEGRSVDSYVRRVKDNLLNSPEISNIKSMVKMEELKKVEKKLARNFGLSEDEVRGKKIDEIIEYINGKNRLSNLSDRDNGEESKRDIYGNGMLAVKGGSASPDDLYNLGSNLDESSKKSNRDWLSKDVNNKPLAAEGKSLSNIESGAIKNILIELNTAKTEKEFLEKELQSYRDKMRELEFNYDSLMNEKRRLESEEVPKYANELHAMRKAQLWKEFESNLFDSMRGLDMIYSHPEQIRRFILPDLRNHLENKFDIDYNEHGLWLRSKDSSSPEKADLRKLVLDYMQKNNLLARNHYTKQYISNMGKAIVAGRPESDSEFSGGAPYLDKAQNNLNRMKG